MTKNVSILTKNLSLECDYHERRKSADGDISVDSRVLNLVSRFNNQKLLIASIQLLILNAQELTRLASDTSSPVYEAVNSDHPELNISQIEGLIYVSNFNVKTPLRGNGFGTRLFELFFAWLSADFADHQLIISTTQPTVENNNIQVPLDTLTLEYHLEKHRLKGWLMRFGFSNIDQDSSDLMLLPMQVRNSDVRSA
jgi:hypothetical protein